MVIVFISVELASFIAMLLESSMSSSKNLIISMSLGRHPTRISPLFLELYAESQPFTFVFRYTMECGHVFYWLQLKIFN